MSVNDEEAQKARAQKIREQIDQMKSSQGKGKVAGEPSSESSPQTPVEFINEKMRELDKKKSQ